MKLTYTEVLERKEVLIGKDSKVQRPANFRLEEMQFMQHDQSTIIEQMRIYDDLKKQNLQRKLINFKKAKFKK